MNLDLASADPALFENPWDPSTDLIHQCYNASAWENRVCTSLIVEEHEEALYHVANLFGDTQGLSALCALLDKVFLPLFVSRSPPDGDARTAAEGLYRIFEKKKEQADRLEDVFYEEVYPLEWARHGALERIAGTQKWVWKPLILACHSSMKTGGRSTPPICLSSIVMKTGSVQMSALVSIVRALLFTIMEEDLASQTSCWFESHRSYWKLWLDWSQAFYDEICHWQQTHDIKGVWNTPQGKLCRVLRPFSTLFPSLSLFLETQVIDKCGMIRIFLYHTFILISWLRIFSRILIRLRAPPMLQPALAKYTKATEAWIDRLSAAGITHLGYYHSIVWSDAFIEHRPLPPLLYLWKSMSNPRKLYQISAFFSTVVFQRSLLLELLESSYAHNELFFPMIREYKKINDELYKTLQTLDFTGIRAAPSPSTAPEVSPSPPPTASTILRPLPQFS